VFFKKLANSLECSSTPYPGNKAVNITFHLLP
jgi:hypothetical protein